MKSTNDSPWHRLLARQIRRYLPESMWHVHVFRPFFSAIDEVYRQADKDRKLLERSLELTSSELIERNQELARKLTQLESTKNALESSHRLLQATLNSTYDGLMVLDLDGKIRLHNPTMRSLFGAVVEMSNFDVFWRQCLSRLSFPDYRRQTEACGERGQLLRAAECLGLMAHSPEKPQYMEFVLDGVVCLEVFSVPQRAEGETGKVIGQVLCFRNVTELRAREAEARHRAYHDELTGLPNRVLFLEQVEEAMRKGVQRGKKTVLIFIDLDGFKDVNDSLGHKLGDILLKEAAGRIEAALAAEDTLSRHGGDEFIALLELQKDTTQVTQTAEAILSAFRNPFVLGKHEVVMSASLGIAVAPNDGTDPEALINKADLAMYHAKEKGKNNYQFFARELERLSSHRLSIRSKLKVAIDRGDFELHFQPKVRLVSGLVEGAEVLIRWRDKQGHFISPMEFIPIAEETGQIIELSQWIIRRCAQYLKSWHNVLPDYFSLAINVSAKHFQRGILSDLEAALTEYDIQPSRLEIELTETAVMTNVEAAINILNALRESGIRTSIDDFGTGYSSLGYLKRLPIDILKIDKSFIDDILVSATDRLLVKGIIEMVQLLGISVVAEGIEKREMGVLLKHMGCDMAQGYYFCKPLPAEDFVRLIKRNVRYTL